MPDLNNNLELIFDLRIKSSVLFDKLTSLSILSSFIIFYPSTSQVFLIINNLFSALITYPVYKIVPRETLTEMFAIFLISSNDIFAKIFVFIYVSLKLFYTLLDVPALPMNALTETADEQAFKDKIITIRLITLPTRTSPSNMVR